MLDIECPYCGTIYETEIHEIAPEEEFTEEQCPSCEKFYAFEYYLQPKLLSVKKLEKSSYRQILPTREGLKIMNEIHKKYKTCYPSILPKGSVGICTDVVNAHVFALKIKFSNGEEFWFMRRDLEEIWFHYPPK